MKGLVLASSLFHRGSSRLILVYCHLILEIDSATIHASVQNSVGRLDDVGFWRVGFAVNSFFLEPIFKTVVEILAAIVGQVGC